MSDNERADRIRAMAAMLGMPPEQIDDLIAKLDADDAPAEIAHPQTGFLWQAPRPREQQ